MSNVAMEVLAGTKHVAFVIGARLSQKAVRGTCAVKFPGYWDTIWLRPLCLLNAWEYRETVTGAASLDATDAQLYLIWRNPSKLGIESVSDKKSALAPLMAWRGFCAHHICFFC